MLQPRERRRLLKLQGLRTANLVACFIWLLFAAAPVDRSVPPMFVEPLSAGTGTEAAKAPGAVSAKVAFGMTTRQGPKCARHFRAGDPRRDRRD